MTDNIMRVNYYYRQFLKVDDFVTDQDYHRNQLYTLTRQMFTAGVAEGLEVTQSGEGLSVSEGFAIDGEGRQIILPKRASLAFNNKANETSILGIRFFEREPNSESEEDEQYQREIDGEVYYSRMIERPRFWLLPDGATINPEYVPLAKIVFDGNSVPRSINNDIRSKVVAKGVPEPTVQAPNAPTMLDRTDKLTITDTLRLEGNLEAVGGLSTAWHANDVTGDVQITRENQWMPISGMKLKINLPRRAVVVCQYNMNVQPNRQPINIVEQEASQPVEEKPKEPVEEKLFLVCTTDGRTARLREAPRLNGKIVGTVNKGDIVEVLDPIDEARAKVGRQGEWIKMRDGDNEEGYSAANLYQIHDIPEAASIAVDNNQLTGTYEVYTVKEGDTLSQIIVDQNLADGWAEISQVVDLVIQLNGLSSSSIRVGQRIQLPREVSDVQPLGNDYLALRVVVDDDPYPQSASHSRPMGVMPPANVPLSGTVSLPLDAGQHTITLQWFKAGTALSSWTCATASLGSGEAKGYLSGRSLSAVAYY